MVGRCSPAWWPCAHFNEQVAGDGVGKVGAELGQLRADLDLGPKSKVAAHLMIYKTHEECLAELFISG